MINLLPPELKTSYRFAHRNVKLRRWVILFVVALFGLGVISTFGLLTLQQSSTHYKNEIASSEAYLRKQKFKETQSHVKDISGSFKLATTMPNNAYLTQLSIGQTKGAIDLTAQTSDYKTATQVQVNLADPANKIFSKADILNITCNGTNILDPRYPCQINMRALFADNNPFLFINSKGTGH
jgi:hypothetical protein